MRGSCSARRRDRRNCCGRPVPQRGRRAGRAVRRAASRRTRSPRPRDAARVRPPARVAPLRDARCPPSSLPPATPLTVRSSIADPAHRRSWTRAAARQPALLMRRPPPGPVASEHARCRTRRRSSPRRAGVVDEQVLSAAVLDARHCCGDRRAGAPPRPTRSAATIDADRARPPSRASAPRGARRGRRGPPARAPAGGRSLRRSRWRLRSRVRSRRGTLPVAHPPDPRILRRQEHADLPDDHQPLSRSAARRSARRRRRWVRPRRSGRCR